MAALTLTQGHALTPADMQALYRKSQANLPSYAMPRFLRVVPTMTMTSTFKQRKVDYVKEGFDPDRCTGDKLYVIDTSQQTYRPLTADDVEAVQSGKIRL